MAITLNGTEVLYVNGIAQNNQLSGQVTPTTTGAIAALATLTNSAITTAASSSTTTGLANVTGLSVNVLAGNSYGIYAYLPLSSNASNGIKVALGGTAGVSSANYTGINWNAASVNTSTNTTTFGNAVGALTGASTLVELIGAVAIATSGTLTVQFAQNARTLIPTQVLANSYLQLV